MKSLKFFAVLGILLLLITMIACISVGSTNIPIRDAFISLFFDTEYSYIIQRIRLPRVLGSLICGGILGLSGVAFQTSFKNELADPYLLGISSGASLSIALGTLLGIVSNSLYSLPLFAFIGAICASLLTIGIDRKSPQSIILSGVALSSLFSALTSFLIYLNKKSLSGVYFWSMGSFSSLSQNKVLVLFFTLTIEFMYLQINSKKLDLLLLDQSSARSLGIAPDSYRIEVLLISAIATSVAVSYCGVIGFAGIIAPHISRKIVGPSHQCLLFSTMIVGSWIMLLADTISRTILAPSEIPVGIITSIIGCPIFLILAIRGRKQ